MFASALALRLANAHYCSGAIARGGPTNGPALSTQVASSI